MGRVKDKKMVPRVMKLVTTSKERLKLATEEIEAFNYGDYVVEKELVELVLKKIIYHFDATVDMELIDGTKTVMKMREGKGAGRGILDRRGCYKIITKLSDKDEAAFILKNGKPKAVLISKERYDRLVQAGIDILDF